MKCPKCPANMETITVASVDIERCTGCHGLWFDEFELADLRATPGAETMDQSHPGAVPATAAGPLHCPKCAGRLIRMADARQPHVGYETCAVCRGVFLDAGEFADLKEQTLMETFRDVFAFTKPKAPRPHHGLSASDLGRILQG